MCGVAGNATCTAGCFRNKALCFGHQQLHVLRYFLQSATASVFAEKESVKLHLRKKKPLREVAPRSSTFASRRWDYCLYVFCAVMGSELKMQNGREDSGKYAQITLEEVLQKEFQEGVIAPTARRHTYLSAAGALCTLRERAVAIKAWHSCHCSCVQQIHHAATPWSQALHRRTLALVLPTIQCEALFLSNCTRHAEGLADSLKPLHARGGSNDVCALMRWPLEALVQLQLRQSRFHAQRGLHQRTTVVQYPTTPTACAHVQ